jgi:aspartyl-tRNA synthetase
MVTLRSAYRTHTCQELRASDVGSRARLSGWILRKRDHGSLVFIDLRDNYGVTQVVLSGELLAQIAPVRVESVITVEGLVVARDVKMTNSKIETGEIELAAEQLIVVSMAEVLPFQIAEDDSSPETTRLQYRFLELRREKLHRNIKLRSDTIRKMRELMFEMEFTEFQTPILTSSSPEGARDFIVPSRHYPGRFFALPQAPQQFKQLLMVSGFDRYFQIAPCFRDEDPRADRSPGEFYQLDIEMSFVEQDDVFAVGERLFGGIFSTLGGKPFTSVPFPRLKYLDCLRDYATDKPDLRVPLKIVNVNQIFAQSPFRVFQSELAKNGEIRAIVVPVEQVPARKYFDDTVEFFTKIAGQGVAYLSFEGGACKGSIAKFVSPEEIVSLKSTLQLPEKAVVFLAAGSDSKTTAALAKLRVKVGQDLSHYSADRFEFTWIVDYPMYERDELTGEIVFSHNPFSMPQGGLEALNSGDPLAVYAYQYDLVCNGYELLSGAIRNHKPEIMYRAFEIAGYPPSTVDEKFGGMINAFKFGAPPHGGFAPGVDRIVMLLSGEETIRDVIAFPLSQTVEDLLMSAPSTISEKQLRECHLQVVMPPKVEKM